MPDIDVDPDQLINFIRTFEHFQQDMQTRMRSVHVAWSACHESWRGATANEFTKEFEEIVVTLENAQTSGDKALHWLQRYYEIVSEFDKL